MKYGESILTQLKKKIEKKDIPVRKWPNTTVPNLNAPDHLIL